MAKKYDLLIINRSDVKGTTFDDKYGPIVRIKHYEDIKRINWEDIWEELSADFYGLDCILRMSTQDKIELSKFLKEFFNYKFNN